MPEEQNLKEKKKQVNFLHHQEWKEEYRLFVSPHTLDLREFLEVEEKPEAVRLDVPKKNFSLSPSRKNQQKKYEINLLSSVNEINLKDKDEDKVFFIRVFRSCEKLIRKLFPKRTKDQEFREPQQQFDSNDLEYEKYLEHHISLRDVKYFFFPSFEKGYIRPFAFFLVALFIFILPFRAFMYYGELREIQKDVETQTAQALELAFGASSSLIESDILTASEEFYKASSLFLEARKKIQEISWVTRKTSALFSSKDDIEQADALLRSASNMTQTAGVLTNTWWNLMHPIQNGGPEHFYRARENAELAIENLKSIESELQTIGLELLPEKFQTHFLALVRFLPSFEKELQRFQEVLALAPTLLGYDAEKRYMVLFQNNNELRPTGGFLGSFALLDVKNGAIKNMEIPEGGTYDLQGSLEAQILSPEPLHLINPRWEFQDANWFFDFPTSAEKIIWFYEQSGGGSIDGVIAINASSVQEFLNILGPITISRLQQEVNGENFIDILQEETEYGYDKKENKPKKIIAEVAPMILEKLQSLDTKQFLPFFLQLQRALKERDIQIFLQDAVSQEKVRGLGWSGEIQETPGDYFALVHTNIGGEKTDRVIEESVRHRTDILENGKIINTVTITRTHHGISGEKFYGASNADYARIYVPKGSELVEVNGFDILKKDEFENAESYLKEDLFLSEKEGEVLWEPESRTRITQEAGKIVFGNWIVTNPGETKTVTIKYQIPMQVSEPKQPQWKDFFVNFWGQNSKSQFSYSLFLQKQSGAENQNFVKEFYLPTKYRTVFEYQSEDMIFSTNSEKSFKLDNDQLFLYAFEQ